MRQRSMPLLRQSVPAGELTMDHVVPLARGGKSTKGNVVPACKPCNNKKKQLLAHGVGGLSENAAERRIGVGKTVHGFLSPSGIGHLTFWQICLLIAECSSQNDRESSARRNDAY
jgi:hypothetical protein